MTHKTALGDNCNDLLCKAYFQGYHYVIAYAHRSATQCRSAFRHSRFQVTFHSVLLRAAAPKPLVFTQLTVISFYGLRHNCQSGPHEVQDMREELSQQKVLGNPHSEQKAATLS